MKRTLQALAVVCLFAAASFGQQAYGNISATSTDCSTANSCVTLALPANSGAVGFDIAGTYVGTNNFEGSFDYGVSYRAISVTPIASTTTVTSTTSTGGWRVAVSGLTNVRVRCSAYTSGTAKVIINASPAAAGLGGGSGTPGGLDTQVQFHDSGAFGGDSGMTYVKSTDALTVVGSVASGSFSASGTNGNFAGVEGTGAGGTAAAVGTDLQYADSTSHCWHQNLNNVDKGCTLHAGSLPAQFTVSAATVSWANQNANIVLAGPASGSAAAPTFRALVAADFPALVSTAGQGGFFAPFINHTGSMATSANVVVASNNLVRAHQFVLPFGATINKISFQVTTGAGAGSKLNIGIYDAAGTTLLLNTGAIDANTTGVITAAVSGGPITLNPGVYWVAWTCDSATLQMQQVLSDTQLNAIMSNSVARSGSAANASVAGVFPSALGAITAVQTRIPILFFER